MQTGSHTAVTEQPAAGHAAGPADTARPRSVVTIRSILLGILACAVASVCFPYTDNVIRGSTVAEDHTAVGVIALFFAIVFFGNGLARLIERRFPGRPLAVGAVGAAAAGVVLYVLHMSLDAWLGEDPSPMGGLLRIVVSFATFLWLMFLLVVLTRLLERMWSAGGWLSLSRAEMLVVFAMLLMTTAVVTSGLGMQLIPTVPAHQYYANAQNRWAELALPYMWDRLRVTDPNAARGFFEGIQRMPGYQPPVADRFGEPLLQSAYETWEVFRQIPWRAWASPLMTWSAFLVPLYLFSICMMIIVRRQWMDREILVYPLTRLPSEMARLDEPGETPHAVGPLFRNTLMWLGFLLPVVFSSLRGIHQYYMGFPDVKLEWQTTLMMDQVTLWIIPSFVAIGFTYLVNTRISLSVWSLSLGGLFLSGWLALRGYKSPENLGTYYGSAGKPLMYHMGTGALLTLAVLGLWSARTYLAGVFRKAFAGDPSVDDSREILTYRAAVLVAIVCAAAMLAWLIAGVGMQWWVALAFWATAMLIFYGLTRIVAEAGLGAVVAPGIAPVFTVSKIGAANMSTTSLAGLGAQYPWSADIHTFVMAGAANSLKLTQEIEHRRRRLFWALLLGVVVSLAVTFATTIYISYKYQGTSLELWYYRDAPAVGITYAVSMLQTQPEANIHGWVYSAIGVALMAFLMMAQRRFLRWPIHPLGLAVMGIWLMERLWFSVFLAWLVKVLVLKYGGPRLYMRTIPFFLGMILGQCVSAGAWLLVDYVTGMVGNQIFTL